MGLGRDRGFSLVELVAAMAIALVVLGGVFVVLEASRAQFESGTEHADVEQRLRVATAVLAQDIGMAGAGPSRGDGAGSLGQFFAPVLPYHLAAVGGDPPGTVRHDAVTLVYVPDGALETSTAGTLGAQSGDVVVRSDPGCPFGASACGFTEGDTVLVFDASGSFDVFEIEIVVGDILTLRHLLPDGPKIYPAGSRIMEALMRTYFLVPDAAEGVDRLARLDAGGSRVPVVDHVVAVSFALYGEPAPPAVIVPAVAGDPWRRRTTYGPGPPAAGESETSYRVGENCTFGFDPTAGTLFSRLTSLSSPAPGELARLTDSQLTDGPWCPDAASPVRFDADLLRVRRIEVKLTVEASLASLRGSDSTWFAHPGTGISSGRLVPDRTVRFDVAPENLRLRPW